MSYASRHFQMLGSMHADSRCCERPDFGMHRNLRRSYDRAFVGQTLRKGKIRNIKPVGIFNAPTYKAGDVYRPKRANQHSKNIVVLGVSYKFVTWTKQGCLPPCVSTLEQFATIIGRKVS